MHGEETAGEKQMDEVEKMQESYDKGEYESEEYKRDIEHFLQQDDQMIQSYQEIFERANSHLTIALSSDLPRIHSTVNSDPTANARENF